MRISRRLLLLASSLCAFAIVAAGPATASTRAVSRSVAAIALQPLRFESIGGGLRASGGGYAMQLMRGSAAVSRGGTGRVVRMTWPGADRSVHLLVLSQGAAHPPRPEEPNDGDVAKKGRGKGRRAG